MNLSFLVADDADRACAVIMRISISPSYPPTSDTLKKRIRNTLEIDNIFRVFIKP